MVSSIYLNGFKVELSSSQFHAYSMDLPKTEDVKSVFLKFGQEWFLHVKGGRLYGFPKVSNPSETCGHQVILQVSENLAMIAARLIDVIPSRFSKYSPVKKRPFTFLAQKQELVEIALKKLRISDALLSGFKVRPKFEIDAKLLDFEDGKPFLSLIIQVNTRWEIHVNLNDLAKAGIDVIGLYVIRRTSVEGKKNLVGRIGKLEGDKVILCESYDQDAEISISDVWLEGSKHNFNQCLKKVLNRQYLAFDQEMEAQIASIFSGQAVKKRQAEFGDYLRKLGPLPLAVDLTATIKEDLNVGNTSKYKTLIKCPPVEYCFDPAKTKRSMYAWKGIESYGPYSRDTFAKKSPRIAVLFPDTAQGAVENFLRQFRDGISSVPFGKVAFAGGFSKNFCLVNPEFKLCKVPWMENKTQSPAKLYRQAAESFLNENGAAFEAALIFILDEQAHSPEDINPYLQSKAIFLMAGIPVQEIRYATAVQPANSLQYTLQNISVALYAKMNGIPWTVNHDLTINDELVIGMGTCELSEGRFDERKRYVGVTTVFRGDGNYLLGNVAKECSYNDYPAILEESTVEILKEIKQRNGWRPGDTVRIVFHAFKPLRGIEVSRIMERCTKIVAGEQNLEFAFLTITNEHPFLPYDINQKGLAFKNKQKAELVPDRGTIIQIGKYRRLLSTNGPLLIKKVTSPLPKPLLIQLHTNSNFRDMTYLTEQVLKFTSLSWRSTLPAEEPVTIYYSELIAGLLTRLRAVSDWSPAMLQVKLRTSRWFL